MLNILGYDLGNSVDQQLGKLSRSLSGHRQVSADTVAPITWLLCQIDIHARFGMWEIWQT